MRRAGRRRADGRVRGPYRRAAPGGERSRVALARALARRPELLLLDEPTAALDTAVADRIGATLRELARGGLGICLATHDARFAAVVADPEVRVA